MAVVAAADADAEEHGGEEEGGPGGPAEGKGVDADVGVAAGGVEGVSGLDKRDAVMELILDYQKKKKKEERK